MLIKAIAEFSRALKGAGIELGQTEISLESDAWERLAGEMSMMHHDAWEARMCGDIIIDDLEEITAYGLTFVRQPDCMRFDETSPIPVDAEAMQGAMGPLEFAYHRSMAAFGHKLIAMNPDHEPHLVDPVTGERTPLTEPALRSIGEISKDILADIERKRTEKPYANAFDVTKSMIEGGD